VQNALDENVSAVRITLDLHPGKPLADLVVEDDSPEGFRNLNHAYTLFAESTKQKNPEKRGRFNLGEKLVLSMCQNACIATTTGTVIFEANGKRHASYRKRERGSVFTATIRMTRVEYEETCQFLKTLLVPEAITVSLNGEVLPPRPPRNMFEASLETEIGDEEGILKRRIRRTRVELFEPLPGEVPTLYELGLPVVATGDRWHINIGQKVPLNLDRDNVPPRFLQSVRTLVLNHVHAELTEEDANTTWVQQATSDPDCSQDAITSFLDLRFGKNRAAHDPSDPEANKAVQAAGGTIVTSRMLNRQQWQKAREAGAIQPAGQILPTAKPYSSDPSAPPAEVVSPEQWTPAMRKVVDYAIFLAKELMDIAIAVTIVRTSNNFVACYGGRRLDFNLGRLGNRWFERCPMEEVDQLLLHEFGHEFSSDHLSHDYHQALCRLGAKLKQVAMEKPDQMRLFQP